jgi:uncharacterized protein YbjQ (UPF0145 family)
MPRTRSLAVLRTAVLATLVLTGCMPVTTRATRLGIGASHPRVAAQDVAVYSATDQIPAKYENVAILVSSVQHRPETEKEMLSSMRRKAAELGANAILVYALDGRTRAEVTRALAGVNPVRKGTAIALYVRPAAAKRQVSEGPGSSPRSQRSPR